MTFQFKVSEDNLQTAFTSLEQQGWVKKSGRSDNDRWIDVWALTEKDDEVCAKEIKRLKGIIVNAQSRLDFLMIEYPPPSEDKR